MNLEFKNGCKNELEDNNEKSCSRFTNKVPLKIDFRADLTHEFIPKAWELKNLVFLVTKYSIITVKIAAAEIIKSIILKNTIGSEFGEKYENFDATYDHHVDQMLSIARYTTKADREIPDFLQTFELCCIFLVKILKFIITKV